MVLKYLVAWFTSSYAFDLTILHTNDVQGHYERFNKYGSDCSAEEIHGKACYGGVARLYTKAKEIFTTEGRDNVLVLDGGDQIQASLWFHVYKGLASAYVMHQVEYEAMVRQTNISVNIRTTMFFDTNTYVSLF